MKYTLKQSKTFSLWFKTIDKVTAIRLLARFARIESGNFGDAKQIANNLFELRFFFGSGYRVYYTIKNGSIVFLLVGGDKTTQAKDIEKAKQLLQSLEDYSDE